MLDQILRHKDDFFKTRHSRINSRISFIDELESYVLNNPPKFSPDTPFWKNYIHAVHISLLMEILGYDLKNWKYYVDNQGRISSILKISQIGNNQEGKVLELLALHSINNVFDFGSNPYNIQAVISNTNQNPTYLTDDSQDESLLSDEENELILGNIRTVMKIRGYNRKEIWGDNDVIVLMKYRDKLQQFCIISCKMSLRERVYQSVFWSMHSRLQGVGKHVFLTADKGTSSGATEIGNRDSENNAKKSRDVLESTMDRVYVLRNSIEVNRSQVIKDFIFLQKDLEQWAQELSGS